MQVNMYGAADAARKRSAEQTVQQRNQGDADEGNAAASHELFYPQLGVKLCSMAGGGVQKIYMVLLREPSRRDRSGSDLFHLRDGFEIKMNFDRNVSCFIFVNAFMNLCFVFCHRQLSSIHENSQTEGVGNEVRQRASKDLANNLNLAMVTIYTFLLFFCCFGCHRGEKPAVMGFSPATGSATG